MLMRKILPPQILLMMKPMFPLVQLNSQVHTAVLVVPQKVNQIFVENAVQKYPLLQNFVPNAVLHKIRFLFHMKYRILLLHVGLIHMKNMR